MLGNFGIQFWVIFLLQAVLIVFVLKTAYQLLMVRKIQNRIWKERSAKDIRDYRKTLAVLGFICGFLLAKVMRYPLHFVLMSAAGFGLLLHELPEEIRKRRNKKLSEHIMNLALIFETGLKTNVPVENIFEICAEQFDDKRFKLLFKQAGAVFMKTRSIVAAFAELKGEIDIPELEMLKMALVEVERMGQSGLVALESFSKLQATKAYEILSKRRDSANTMTTVAIACVLITAMLVYYAPIYRIVMQNIVNFFLAK